MESLVLKAILAMIGALFAIIGYFLKQRDRRIEKVEQDIILISSKVNILQEKIESLDKTSLPILIEIHKEVSELKSSLGVVKTEIKSLHKYTERQERYTERQDEQILSLRNSYNRRKDDE